MMTSMRLAQRQVRPDDNAHRAQATHFADVLPLPWMIGRFQRGGDGQLPVVLSEDDQPLAHAAGGAVDGDVGFHECVSNCNFSCLP